MALAPPLVKGPHSPAPVAGPPPLDMFKRVQFGPHCTGTLLPFDIFKLVHHESTYGWQVGGWHPTGMLSCFVDIYFV